MQHKLLFSAIALALSYSAQAVIVPEGTQLDEKQHIVINNGAEPQRCNHLLLQHLIQLVFSYRQ